MLLFQWHNQIENFDFDKVLIDEYSDKNILVYDISYKILIGSKPLHIRFDEIGAFVRVYDGTRYLVLFALEKSDDIYNRIIY